MTVLAGTKNANTAGAMNVQKQFLLLVTGGVRFNVPFSPRDGKESKPKGT
ncbi:MAG TPA: hypothetical protein VLZ50_10850 [Terracidiphilus sp.]|nr:hypothetical protein [Terracidiphilus sp.]